MPREDTQFRPGESGNPAGRPVGAKNRTDTLFWEHVHAKWQKHGETILDRMIENNPGEFAKMVAQHLPRQLEVRNTSAFEEMSIDELTNLVTMLETAITKGIAVPGIGEDGATDETQH
jgi:Family of unknown function (DUF5681)